jgi:hypothetical protein
MTAVDNKKMDEVLREAVAASGRSIYSTARAAGLSVPRLYDFQHGRQSLSLASADKLARTLGLRLVQEKEAP